MKTRLQNACGKGDVSKARALIEDGSDIDCRDEDGMTPLHMSCIQKDFALFSLLIKNRAAVNFVDNNGMTALSLACKHHFTDIIPTLLNEGADPFAGVGLLNIPWSCALYVTEFLAYSGRCAFCGKSLPTFPSPVNLPHSHPVLSIEACD
jgi:hypothetical protein